MKLAKWLEKNGLSARAFARMIGVTPPTISNVIAGKGTPTLAIAARIEAATGGEIAITSHLSEGEKKKIARLRKVAA
jgi:transcriptional regulator with XRE-family HTH domain